VLVCDPHLSAEAIALAGAEGVALDELLERSDFVSVHAAATDETRGLIGARELARMKPGACLVNTARAALVDEAALEAALRGGRLGGAALDVFSVEPPGSDHPLLALDTVIATPHVAGNTVEVGAHQARTIADDLARLLRGERPHHVLNPQVLASFDWARPRPQPSADILAQLATRPAPAVSDLQRDRRPAPARPAAPVTATTAASPAAAAITARMRAVLAAFVARLPGDAALRSAAAGKCVTLHFALPDVGASFYLRLAGDGVMAGLGESPRRADVELKMPAVILDGMFMGTANPMQAAMQGRLSFSGDTVKAMALQSLQPDLSRLYRAARAEAGDPGDLAALVAAAPAGAAPAAGPGDIRTELVQIVNELYARELITATGGNVSARIPGSANEIWITPGQLFKGQLRPEMLVRLDLDGRSLDPGAPSPSSERLVHCAVYRVRPDAQAIVHAHAPHATILADTGLPFLPISTEAAFFGDIPRVPFIMPGTEELAAAVAEAARRSWAVLMQNHGLLVAGRSLRRAADMVEIIERSAEIILGCYAVDKPPPTLPAEVVQTLQKMGDLLA
jgi:autoinducer 2 (AI-2) kinase